MYEGPSSNAGNRSLATWFAKIRTGELQLPRFQRFQAWPARNITDVLQAVVDGLPIGAALILEVGDNKLFRYRPLPGAPKPKERLTELLLDGQQRLAAMWRALSDNYDDRTYFIRWATVSTANQLSPTGAPEDLNVARLIVEDESRRVRAKDGQIAPLWTTQPAETYARGLIPLRLMRPDHEAEAEFEAWLSDATPDLALQKALQKISLKLRSAFANYNIPYILLPSITERHVVLDVFVKLNTRVVKLTSFDVVVAQVEDAAGESLHDLVGQLRTAAPEFITFTEPEDVVLQICALLQDRVPNEAGFYALDFDKLVEQWPLLLKGAARAGDFLRQERILDGERLPTEVILPPLAALWAQVPETTDAVGNARIALRRYLWTSFLTRRYERAAATAVLQDYRALRDSLINGKAVTPPIFDETLFPLATAEDLVLAEWPKGRDRLARAVLQLSLLAGADDLADGTEVTPSNASKREYHHLFPRAYLVEKGVPEGSTFRALNCALISWRTNRTISAKSPLTYLLDRTKSSSLGESEIRRRLGTHSIAYDDLAHDDYETFLIKRAARFSGAIKALASGQPWRGFSDSNAVATST